MGDERHVLLRPEPSCALSSGVCFFPLGPHCWGAEIQISIGYRSQYPLLLVHEACPSPRSGEGFSVPRVSPVLLVVELQFDLIFYLIHEDLGQQDSHQLRDGQA